jgi:phosphohistidine phosphatase
MHLYLLRHADAEDLRTSDADRTLTPKGREQSETVARFCRRCAVRPDYILTSPFRRAQQTADAVAAALDIPTVVENFLASGMDAATALRELRAYLGCQSVMIVGHQPDLGELIAALLALDSPMAFPVPKASLTALDVRSLSRAGASLIFALPPRMMS